MENITIKGARQHNLQNVSVTIPRNKLVVISGLSGSGKSSLAFDTLYAAGQRRYLESLSTYARAFIGTMDKPEVDSIEGLSPAIAIQQKSTNRNPRSTVGTITEIYDYYRLLYARIGVAHCPKCGRLIEEQSVDQIVNSVMSWGEGTKVEILAPVIKAKKGEHQKVLSDAKAAGFVRVRVDGVMTTLDDVGTLNKTQKHTIEIVVDRLVIGAGVESRLASSVETALSSSDGTITIRRHGVAPSVSPNFLATGGDKGAGSQGVVGDNFPNTTSLANNLESKNLEATSTNGKDLGSGSLGNESSTSDSSKGEALESYSASVKSGGRNIDENAQSTDAGGKNIITSEKSTGEGGQNIGRREQNIDDGKQSVNGEVQNVIAGQGGVIDDEVFFSQKNACPVCGISMPELSSRLFSFNNPYGACKTCLGVGRVIKESTGYFTIYGDVCPVCKGKRLRPEALAVTVADVNIDTLCSMSIKHTKEFFEGLHLSEHDNVIAAPLISEVRSRLDFLLDVGVGYLALSREAGTLSGGESQRLRLASCLGSALSGVMYVLDEPSIGLHQSDNQKLLATLFKLRDLGNCVIVVEHDEETLRSADYLIDMGPRAGVLGGKIIAKGTVEEVMNTPESLTGQYLSGAIAMPAITHRRGGSGQFLTIEGASEHNLKGVCAKIPLGTFTCVTGVSGSGKSTLVNSVLLPVLSNKLMGTHMAAGRCAKITGVEALDKVININQEPIGRSPRSNPATYTGVFNGIRDVFASTATAKALGFTKSRFSFNVSGGRCEACGGSGVVTISMDFLSDVYVRCDVCDGKRFNRETLSVLYKGRSICDVLKMTIDEAAEVFASIPHIARKLATLQKVGLGYIELGQNALSLSGGEAQRVKLANELARVSTGRTLYIMDEPTTGLHFCDVKLLMEVVQSLVDQGNTVVMIEHNLDVIRQADYIIDLGPGGGDAGGRVVAQGTPEVVKCAPQSLTGRYL